MPNFGCLDCVQDTIPDGRMAGGGRMENSAKLRMGSELVNRFKKPKMVKMGQPPPPKEYKLINLQIQFKNKNKNKQRQSLAKLRSAQLNPPPPLFVPLSYRLYCHYLLCTNCVLFYCLTDCTTNIVMKDFN